MYNYVFKKRFLCLSQEFFKVLTLKLLVVYLFVNNTKFTNYTGTVFNFGSLNK